METALKPYVIASRIIGERKSKANGGESLVGFVIHRDSEWTIPRKAVLQRSLEGGEVSA